MKLKFSLPFDINLQSGFTTPLRMLLATTAAFWMGTASAQINPVGVPRPVPELRFRDFFQTPIGPAGLEFTDALRNANGQEVRLVGYMVQQDAPTPGRFMLTPRPVQMSEHADGEADDLPPSTVVVYLDAAQKDWAVPYVRGLVSVRGRLGVSRFEEADGRVSWVRLQLGPESVHAMSSAEIAGYLHYRQHKH
jgi:hypothetical protein